MQNIGAYGTEVKEVITKVSYIEIESGVKKEITNTLLDPDIADIPIAILANKIDIPGAVSEEEFKSIMMLNDSCTGKLTPTTSLTTRPFEVFMCTLKKKSGYGLCFKWLANYV